MNDKRFHHFQIEIPERLFGGKILMDGAQVKGVRAIKIDASIDSPTIITLELIATVDCNLPTAEIKNG
jgi:hypothetical protein